MIIELVFMVLSTILGLLVDWTTFKRSRRRFPILCLTFLFCTFYPFFFLAIYPTIIADRLPTYNDRTYDMHFFYLTPVYVLIYYVNLPPPSRPHCLVLQVWCSSMHLIICYTWASKTFWYFLVVKIRIYLEKNILPGRVYLRENITIFLNKIADCTH